MLADVPLTGLTTGFSCLVMTLAWVYLGQRIKKANTDTLRSLEYMRAFFLYMGIFTGFMTAPLFWLPVSPAAFSTAMAYGFTIGHIFLYVACANIALMMCTVVPQMAQRARLITTFWVVAATVLTVVNAKTMIWGIKPIFDPVNHLSEFRVDHVLGVVIAVVVALAFVPAIILFVIGAINGRGSARIKSSLMALGILTIMVGGPLHNLAHTAGAYALADISGIIGVIIFGLGIAYRVEKSFAPMPTHPLMKAAPSNTV